jgi:predicted RNA-binding protein YlqC (UPF0109 family)
MNNSIDQEFVEFVVKSLVGNPDAVQVERRIDEKGVLLELTVDPEDLGRVIGKRGATAQSLRTLLRALGTKNDARYNLKIIDNGDPSLSHSSSDDSIVAPTAPASDDDSYSATPVAADEPDEVDTTEDSKAVRESDVVSKTRRELAELDDLDV